MQANVKFKVGGAEYNIQFNDSKEMELMHKMIMLGNPPRWCNECKNPEYFKLDANKDKEGNIYISVLCKKCGAKAKLGQYKTGSYFWHKFQKYERKETNNASISPNIEPPTVDLDETNSYGSDGSVGSADSSGSEDTPF